jgi:hypothetical protein
LKYSSLIPFAKTRLKVNNGLAPFNFAKSSGICIKHLIIRLRKEASDVDVGDALTVL